MKYPSMRKELIEYVRCLSDLSYQRDCSVKDICPTGTEHDELDYAIHFLFDDTELATNPRELVGWILEDETEVSLIYQLCQNLKIIFEKYSTNLINFFYT